MSQIGRSQADEMDATFPFEPCIGAANASRRTLRVAGVVCTKLSRTSVAKAASENMSPATRFEREGLPKWSRRRTWSLRRSTPIALAVEVAKVDRADGDGTQTVLTASVALLLRGAAAKPVSAEKPLVDGRLGRVCTGCAELDAAPEPPVYMGRMGLLL